MFTSKTAQWKIKYCKKKEVREFRRLNYHMSGEKAWFIMMWSFRYSIHFRDGSLQHAQRKARGIPLWPRSPSPVPRPEYLPPVCMSLYPGFMGKSSLCTHFNLYSFFVHLSDLRSFHFGTISAGKPFWDREYITLYSCILFLKMCISQRTIVSIL